MCASIAPVEALVVDLVYVLRAGAVEQPLLVVLVLVLFFKVLLLNHVVPPQSAVLDSLDLRTSH